MSLIGAGEAGAAGAAFSNTRHKPGFRVWQNERVSPGPGFSKTRVAIPSLLYTKLEIVSWRST